MSSRSVSRAGACRVRIVAPRDEAPAAEAPGAASEGEICVEEPGGHEGLLQQSRRDSQACSCPAAGSGPATSASWTREGYLYVTGPAQGSSSSSAAPTWIPADIEEVVDSVPGRALLGGGRHRQRAHRVAAAARRRRGARARARPPTITTISSARSRAASIKALGHRPARVLLVRSSTIPKTSSGKIQRARLVQMIEEGELRRAHRSTATTSLTDMSANLQLGCHLPVYGPAATRDGTPRFRAPHGSAWAIDSLWASDHIVIPYSDRVALSLQPHRRLSLSPTTELPRAADGAGARRGGDRAHPPRARPCWSCPTATRSWPPRCSRPSITWRRAASFSAPVSAG